MNEIWKDIPGQEGRYQVSDLGRARSLDRVVVDVNGVRRRLPGCVLKPQKHSMGYVQYTVSREHHLGHVLVLETFKGARPLGMQAAHNDGDRTNNRLTNLRWATPTSNAADKRKHGTNGEGETNSRAKLTTSQIHEIRARVALGEFQRDVGHAFGVSQYHVSRVCSGTRWAHVV